MKQYSILASIILGLQFSPALRATQTISDSLGVTGTLTVKSDALFETSAIFGRIPSQNTSGYVTDVYQGISTIQREEIIPGHDETQTIYKDDYGWISTVITGDNWGWVLRDVWVPDQYDEEGNITVYGHYEPQSVWEVVSSYSWPTTVWGVVGSHSEPQTVWVAEQRNTYTDTVYGIPVVRHTGQRHDVVWSWRNQNPNTGETRELMQLSPAGLSLPHPTDPYSRTVLTSTNFEQSYLIPTVGMVSGGYLSYGTKMLKERLETWMDEGTDDGLGNVTVDSSHSVKVKADEVLIEWKQPAGAATSTTASTRIAATSATFGGSIAVTGTVTAAQKVRVPPGGDLPMAAEFQNDGGLGVPGAQ